MSNTNTGGPAFPTEYREDATQPCAEGMTLRDYFAAKAMQSLIINTDESSAFEADQWVGRLSYEIADAMLTARKE